MVEGAGGMDRLAALLELVRDRGLVAGHFRGLCHVVIGRRVTGVAGEPVSAGVTWRELSALLRDLRFDKNLVTEVGANPDDLAPRDRQRYWYSAIALARPDSVEARVQADALIAALAQLGYAVGPPPAPPTRTLSSPPPTVEEEAGDEAPPTKRGKRKK